MISDAWSSAALALLSEVLTTVKDRLGPGDKANAHLFDVSETSLILAALTRCKMVHSTSVFSDLSMPFLILRLSVSNFSMVSELLFFTAPHCREALLCTSVEILRDT